jgi:16S rRNA (uracil1498-N3)-methyltransferase
MNIVLAQADEIEEGRLFLNDRRAEHIVKVLRAEVGDQLRVGLVDGPSGRATITALKRKYPFSVALSLSLTAPPAPVPPIDLVLALPRPIMLRRILSQVAALGVGRIDLVNAGRVEKSFWEAGILQPEEYRPHLLQGLEQAVDTRLPQLASHRRLSRFLAETFAPQAGGYRHRLIAHPGGTSLAATIAGQPGRVALAVGPEGGWLDQEVAAFVRHGFVCCGLGERILKVDTAVVALHARVSALQEWLVAPLQR